MHVLVFWLVVVFLAVLICLILAVPVDVPPIRFDFENAGLQGWKMVWGDLEPQPTDAEDDRWGGNFNKQGKYFIGTCEAPGGTFDDALTGELWSPAFRINYDRITLLVGGGHLDATYVALHRASDGKELFREIGRNREAMEPRYWDVREYKGMEVYIKVVNRAKGGWGHVNVDDIREMTPQEVKEMKRKEAERKKKLEAQFKAWLKTLEAPPKRKVYRGGALTDLAMPMGGIGAGNIVICGDGSLDEWQIFNIANSKCMVPGGFFAVWAKPQNGEAVCKLLQLRPINELPRVEGIEYIGEYPIAYLKYKDAELPVQVSLEAFSPFIPLNAKDSALPGIIFIFSVKNTGRDRVNVSLATSLQNAVGYDGFSAIEGIENKDYGGNANEVVRRGELTAVHMVSKELPADARTYGSMTLGTISSNASYIFQWDDIQAFWSDFAKDGVLDNVAVSTSSEKGKTWNGALAVPLELKPGEEKDVAFFITWYFPNHYIDWDKNLAQYRLGNMYNNWFDSSLAAAEYVVDNFERLVGETRLFHDTFYDSNLPYYLLDCISSQISTIRSQTCMWLEDGMFAAFEGARCCPMNCTHVWNYEQMLAKLFPSLERNMRETDLKIQQDPSGFVHHRTVLPLSLPRGSGPFVDGHLGTILKAYREYFQSPDRSWLDELWPKVKLAMQWAMKTYDPDGNGVIEGEQWNTYDCALYGPNTFIGSLWLAALRAAEEMAKLEGDTEFARECQERYEKGRAAMDSDLWNGEYWIQKYDETKYTEMQYGTGCYADQLLGQWWAHTLGLGYIFPEEHVKTALKSIFKYNWRTDFYGFMQIPRVFAGEDDKGLLCCSWPKGGKPSKPTLYSDEVWTGLEYEVAGLMIYEGLIDEALQIVKGARDRYDGVPRQPFKRNPWNEIECGEHYARPMSSWGLLLAAEGYIYNGPEGLLGFKPRLNVDNFRGFFSGAAGWGTFSQRRGPGRQLERLAVKYGELELKELVFKLPEGVGMKLGDVVVRVAGDKVKASWHVKDKEIRIRLSERIKVQAVQTVKVIMSW